MNSSKWAMLATSVALLGGTVLAVGADKPEKPAKAAHHNVAPKVVKPPTPYNLLTDLTDDQKTKMADIHKQELEAEKKLKDQETADLMALLTPDQVTELKAAEDKVAAERKAKTQEDRAKMKLIKAQEDKDKLDKGATSQPSN